MAAWRAGLKGRAETPDEEELLAAEADLEGRIAAPAGSNEAPSPHADWVPVAMCIVHPSYSTWQGRSIYVEDLYVSPPFRQFGIAKACFAAVSRAAAVGGFARVQFCALDWNTRATSFYTGPSLGAVRLEGWSLFRMYRDTIERVAGLPKQQQEQPGQAVTSSAAATTAT